MPSLATNSSVSEGEDHSQDNSDYLNYYYGGGDGDSGELQAAHYIWIVGGAVLLLVGTAGNVLALAVLSRPALRRSNASVYLMVVAVADLAALYTGLLRQVLMAASVADLRHHSEAMCKVHTMLVYFSLDLSAWVLAALAMERFLSVRWPHRLKRHCTRLTSACVITVIGLLLLAINAHFLFRIGDATVNLGKLEIRVKCVPLSEEDYHFVVSVWPWVDLGLFALLPLSVHVVCNVFIVTSVVRSLRQARRTRGIGELESERRTEASRARRVAGVGTVHTEGNSSTTTCVATDVTTDVTNPIDTDIPTADINPCVNDTDVSVTGIFDTDLTDVPGHDATSVTGTTVTDDVSTDVAKDMKPAPSHCITTCCDNSGHGCNNTTTATTTTITTCDTITTITPTTTNCDSNGHGCNTTTSCDTTTTTSTATTTSCDTTTTTSTTTTTTTTSSCDSIGHGCGTSSYNKKRHAPSRKRNQSPVLSDNGNKNNEADDKCGDDSPPDKDHLSHSLHIVCQEHNEVNGQTEPDEIKHMSARFTCAGVTGTVTVPQDSCTVTSAGVTGAVTQPEEASITSRKQTQAVPSSVDQEIILTSPSEDDPDRSLNPIQSTLHNNTNASALCSSQCTAWRRTVQQECNVDQESQSVSPSSTNKNQESRSKSPSLTNSCQGSGSPSRMNKTQESRSRCPSLIARNQESGSPSLSDRHRESGPRFSVQTTISQGSRSSSRTVRQNGSRSARLGRQSDEGGVSSMTWMLVTVSSVFCLTTLPISLYNLINWILVDRGYNYPHREVAWAVVNILMYINNAVNFLLYSLSGSRFRAELGAMWRRGCRRRAPGHLRQRCHQRHSTCNSYCLTCSATDSSRLSGLGSRWSASTDLTSGSME